MKRFKSRIESLRRVREQTELLAKMSTAVRQKEKSDADQLVGSMREALSRHHHESRTLYDSGLTGSTLEIMLAREDQDRSNILAAMTQQKAAELRLQSAIAEHSRAQSELKIVNQLIDREKKVHRREQLLAEEHTQFEAAAQAFHKKQNEPATEQQQEAAS